MIPDLSGAFRGDMHDSFLLKGSGTAVVLIHGFPGTPAEMRHIAQIFQHHGWSAHGLLLPGFGKELAQLATRNKHHWLEAIADTVNQLKTDHERIILCGNSMGGALALATASQIQVDGLILFAPFCGIQHILWQSLPVLKHLFPAIKPFRLFKPNFNDPAFRESLLKFMPDANLDDPQVQHAITQLTLPIRLFDEIRQVGKLGFTSASMINCPTLILQGGQDELVRPSVTNQLLRQFRGNVIYHEFEAGHDMVEDSRVRENIQATIDKFITNTLGG